MIADGEHVDDLEITLSEPWIVHHIPAGMFHYVAGNVGEWTATEDPHWPGRKIWKGRSFNLGPEMQRCSSARLSHMKR